MISVFFFFLSGWVGDYLIYHFYDNSDYDEKRNQEYAARLQKYLDENQLTTEDKEQLTAWVLQQRVISLLVYKDNILIYDSEYPKADLRKEHIEAGYHGWENYYTVQFADGEAQISIFGMYVFQFRHYALIGELLLSFALFVGIVMLGIRKTMGYIRRLCGEIKLLEGGELDYEITVKGSDELAQLARGLDDMRRSFRDKVEQEARLMRSNQKMITEMSHDLRTPLTTIMLYTEILLKQKYKNEEQMWAYIEKIHQKTCRMKQLSDHLFEYALILGEVKADLEEPMAFETVFYDLLSETCAYLKQNGFRLETDLCWERRMICVNTNYIARILDNLTSNIIKYGDQSSEVYIKSLYTEERAGFIFENVKKRVERKTDSTGIGLGNVKSMMKQMGGSFQAEETGESFRTVWLFPCVE